MRTYVLYVIANGAWIPVAACGAESRRQAKRAFAAEIRASTDGQWSIHAAGDQPELQPDRRQTCRYVLEIKRNGQWWFGGETEAASEGHALKLLACTIRSYRVPRDAYRITKKACFQGVS